MATAKPSGVTSSINASNQTGRSKEDLPTLKIKVTEVYKFHFVFQSLSTYFSFSSLNVKSLIIKSNWMNYVVLKLQPSLN